MSGQGIAPDRRLRGRPDRARATRSASTWRASTRARFRRPLARRAIERGFYRLVRTDPTREQDWKSYAKTVLVFSVVFSALLYAIQRLQGHLFLNPDHLQGVPSHIALNTTASFVTNTNWQYYGGEYTMSYLTQMAGLAVQNFVSAGGRHGRARRGHPRLRAPLVEGARQLLGRPLPLARLHPAAAVARSSRVILLSQGVPQTFARPRDRARRSRARTQTIARGPVALA